MTLHAAVRSMLATKVSRVYDMGDVPTSATAPYLVLSVLPGSTTTYTNEARHAVRDYRITCQVFGRTDDSALSVVTATDAALLDQWVADDGREHGPIRQELPPARMERDPDAGGYLGVTFTYTFATTEEG